MHHAACKQFNEEPVICDIEILRQHFSGWCFLCFTDVYKKHQYQCSSHT